MIIYLMYFTVLTKYRGLFSFSPSSYSTQVQACISDIAAWIFTPYPNFSLGKTGFPTFQSLLMASAASYLCSAHLCVTLHDQLSFSGPFIAATWFYRFPLRACADPRGYTATHPNLNKISLDLSGLLEYLAGWFSGLCHQATAPGPECCSLPALQAA